jgi:DNA-binding CsgD family transcriptional regulator/PAS domain-containing protein
MSTDAHAVSRVPEEVLVQPGHQQLSKVIGAIYDSAIDPQLWPVALEEMCGLVGAFFGSITIASPASSTFQFVSRWGGDPYWIELLDRKYANLMPFLPVLDRFELCEPFNMAMAAAYLDDDSVWDGPFVTEWANPAGVGDSASAVLLRSQHRLATVGLGTRIERGHVSQEQLDVLGMLTPHLRRALTISDLIEMRSLAADTLERMLDSLQLGVVAIDARHRVRHANHVAAEMLAKGGPLSIRDGKVVVPRSPTSTMVLHEAISRAARDEATMAGNGAGIPLRFADGRPAIGHVLPLRRPTVRQEAGAEAVAAIFIATPTDLHLAPLDALVKLYGLTEGEGRVLSLIATGQNRRQTAASLAIADSTVKSHLDHIFAKTGTSTQPELVRLLTSLSAPASPVQGGV